MAAYPKLRGSIIASSDYAHGTIALITFQLRHRTELAFYPHPYEIDTQCDFVIVFSQRDLELAFRYYQSKKIHFPLLIHIDTPEHLRLIDYNSLCPGVDVLPIPQANLSAEPDVTLDLHLYSKITQRLHRHV
jgi:hypothetical protein